MLSEFVEAPYIVLPFGLATPALIFSIIYLLLYAILIIHGKNTSSFQINWVCFSKISNGRRNKIIISSIGYLICILSCIFITPFLDENNLLLTVSIQYLKYEPIIFLCILVFLFTSIATKSNRESHIVAANKIFRYAIWLSTGFGLLAKQIDYTFWQNIIVLTCATIINYLLMVIDIKPLKPIENNSGFDFIQYKPSENLEELFPRHRAQAEDIANIISDSSSEPFSICLSGRWGEGKTSVINGVVDKLENIENCVYDFIRINALELDDKKAMLNYLMLQIKAKLKAQGVFVGIESEYKEFVASTMGTLTTDAYGKLLKNTLLNSEGDYRKQKEKLEDVLSRTYKNGKLVVIVDDIERCNRNVARDYLFLIKEVATMKNCVSIFITDFDILNNIVSERPVAENYKTDNFLDKFFNYRINLRKESAEDILSFYDKHFKEDDKAFQPIYELIGMSPGTWFNTVITSMNTRIEKKQSERKSYYSNKDDEKAFYNEIANLKNYRDLFVDRMQLPRNMAKFYNVFRNSTLRCYEKMLFGLNSDQKKDVLKFLENRNIEQILFVLTFIEVCTPVEYQRLLENGAHYLEFPLYSKSDDENDEKRLICELVKGLIFGEFSTYRKPTAYLKEEIRKFIEAFVDVNSDLIQLVNTFTSQEEEWLDALKNNKKDILETNWLNIILMVLNKTPNISKDISNEWRNETFSLLLDFAEEQIELGMWTTDKLFELFDSDMRTDRLFATGTGIMQVFWNHLSKFQDFATKSSNDYLEDILRFSHHYAYIRISSLYRMAHYLIPIENGNEKTENLQEYLLNSTQSFEKNISEFIENFTAVIPNITVSDGDWHDKYINFSNLILEFLEKNDLMEYDDVKEDVEQMCDSAEEFLCLKKIIEWIQGDKKTGSDTPTCSDKLKDIDETIKYFEELFNIPQKQIEKSRDIDREFTDFFRGLKDSKNMIIPSEQIKQLHKLVTVHVQQSGYSSLPFRRVLLRFSNKNKMKTDEK